MHQLILNLHRHAAPTLSNFVAGENSALLSALENIQPENSNHILLWGARALGKTHLLSAASKRHHGQYISASNWQLPGTSPGLLVIDDVEQLTEDAQIDLFNIINRANIQQQSLLLSSRQSPLLLTGLREDLRTRLGQMLIFAMAPISDAIRRDIMQSEAERRDLSIDQEVLDYLLRFGARDIPSLMSYIARLDEAAWQFKRRASMPLLRQLLRAPDALL